jgi:ABC-type nitrate/sulfonate/bicarbonate transport system substrate-binding protein
MSADLRIVDVGGAHEHVTIALMRAERCFERAGVTVERRLVANGAEAVDLLLAGEADAAIQVGFGPALAAIADGAPLKVIAGANLLTVHALYARDPTIRGLEDLKGRTLGVGALGALTHQLAFAALRRRGVDPAEVRFVSIGSSAKIFQALLRGEVDAGFGETDVYEHQDSYGVHALDGGVLWEELRDFPNQASFATTAALESKGEALTRVLAAHALLYRRLQSPDSWDAFARAWTEGLPDAPLKEGLSQWRFYQQHRPFAEDLRIPEAGVSMLQDLNIAMGRQNSVLPFDAIADLSFAREAVRRLDAAPALAN